MKIYAHIRKRARQIVLHFPPPAFYKDFSRAINSSRYLFETDPVVGKLRKFVSVNLEDNFGHGLKHAVKVTLDAGALVYIEHSRVCQKSDRTDIHQRIRLVQCAGLLHDIKRKEENHAGKGAEYARQILPAYPFAIDEIEDICRAIQNHEAFKSTIPVNTVEGRLVSDCLYDADKFRWGPDNFTDTIWDMVSSSNIPLSEFMEFYPKGLEMLKKVKPTFRSGTGKKYGPQFIDIGIAIGQELYQVIRNDFAHLL